MANIIIDTNWFKPARADPPLGRLRRRLLAFARLRRMANYRRRLMRPLSVDTLDKRLLEDIGIAAPRNRLYDCIERLARAQGGSR